ncbi:MAG: inositol monophosphatase [Candidatus Thiodiazotropha taylori]|nr:inositol monophosphatase [Candidatus Thiodiazotropha taylori]
MLMQLPQLQQLTQLVKQAAVKEVRSRFQQTDSEKKLDGSLITAADLGCQQWLTDALKQAWPDIPLLGEEMMPEQHHQLLQNSDSGLWVLDPLDGTANFAAGFPHFSVSLALVQSGQVVQGVVYDPMRDECFSAAQGEGAWLNGARLVLNPTESALEECIAVVDFKRLSPTLATALAVEPPFRSQRSLGSVALDWCWMAAARGQIYHHGGQSLWDYAAGRLIFAEAGGTFSSPEVNLSLEKQAAVAAVSKPLHHLWRAWLERMG